MKKTYLSLAAMILCGSVFAQTPFDTKITPLEQAKLAPNTTPPIRTNNSTRAAFSMWVEPVGDIMFNKGYLLDQSASADQAWYLNVINCDSTVQVSSSTTRTVSTMYSGTVLDLTSSNLQSSLNPIISKADAYTVDSLLILSSYVKVTSTTDTLYVNLVWGDTSNTAVWAKRANSATYVAPISGWRTSVIGPMVTGAVAGNGNLVSMAAPASNKLLVKYVLTNTDSVSSAGRLKYINIPLSAPVSIPAGNIVSCQITFVPGATPASGAIAYSFPGGQPQTVNGFGTAIWNQRNPAVNVVADYQDHQVDPTSFCMGTSYDKRQRHASTANFWSGVWNEILGNLNAAPVIYYKVSGNSTISVNDLEKNGFVVSQNMPNPFSSTSTINYQLLNKSEVSLFVYDVTGKKVAEQYLGEQTSGRQSVQFDAANLSAGVYYYSLKVNNNFSSAQKMVIVK